MYDAADPTQLDLEQYNAACPGAQAQASGSEPILNATMQQKPEAQTANDSSAHLDAETPGNAQWPKGSLYVPRQPRSCMNRCYALRNRSSPSMETHSQQGGALTGACLLSACPTISRNTLRAD